MTAAADRLCRALDRSLRAAADPSRAPAMQAYMKSAMPYLGVPAGPLRVACRESIAAHPLASAEEWRAAILALWRAATHREQRYAAIELCRAPRYRSFRSLEMLPVYEEMIVSGAWWDYVDVVAVHLVGDLLRRHPVPLKRTLRQWSRCGDLWKRRSAILAQLSFKADTDLDLLYECIERAVGAPDFFLRKAIGWALREYSKTDAREVKRYVAANAATLSPLSRREALKVIERAG